jgi:biotin carboxylase
MRSDPRPLTVLCLASEEKGHAFIRECHRQGCRVLLVTRQALAGAGWPREAIDEIFFMPSLLQSDDLLKGVSYLARSRVIDRIVPLDDFDLEAAALIREHLRIPGMGQTTTRYFRDKLAMRMGAQEAGILVPEFVHAANDAAVHAFLEGVPSPWVLKPRGEAGSAGIKKVHGAADVWARLEQLGDERSFYLIERFVPGDIFHFDAVVSEREVAFEVAHQYGRPPMEVVTGGGLFSTRTLRHDSEEAKAMGALARELYAALGFVRGVAHTEFIRARDDGRFYFLETAARAGGAHIVDVVEAATGVNLHAELAKIEIGGGKVPYSPPPHRREYAGIVLSLAREEWPDTSAYDDPEVVMRIRRPYHAGLIVASPDAARVEQLLEGYSRRFLADFAATQPYPETLRR